MRHDDTNSLQSDENVSGSWGTGKSAPTANIAANGSLSPLRVGMKQNRCRNSQKEKLTMYFKF